MTIILGYPVSLISGNIWIQDSLSVEGQYSFSVVFYIYFCVCLYKCETQHMQSEDNPEEQVLSFYHAHSGDGAQASRLGSKHVHLVRHVGMSVVFEIGPHLVSRLAWNHVGQMPAFNAQQSSCLSLTSTQGLGKSCCALQISALFSCVILKLNIYAS